MADVHSSLSLRNAFGTRLPQCIMGREWRTRSGCLALPSEVSVGVGVLRGDQMFECKSPVYQGVFSDERPECRP